MPLHPQVGVVGLGGLGHMAVKIAKAMGCEVTVISRSDAKKADAKALGADHYLVSGDEAAMTAAAGEAHARRLTMGAEWHGVGLV